MGYTTHLNANTIEEFKSIEKLSCELTNSMERPNVVKNENFLHLVWNILSEVFDESVHVYVVLWKDIKYWQPSDFRKASVSKVDD